MKCIILRYSIYLPSFVKIGRGAHFFVLIWHGITLILLLAKIIISLLATTSPLFKALGKMTYTARLGDCGRFGGCGCFGGYGCFGGCGPFGGCGHSVAVSLAVFLFFLVEYLRNR